MPERERVAGVQPAVRELVHGLERQLVERVELAHAGEVEERVAAELPGDRPERDPEADPGQRRRPQREPGDGRRSGLPRGDGKSDRAELAA